MLAECIVALALLAIAISGSSSVTRAATLLSDDATTMALAQSVASAHAEGATLDACADPASGDQFSARIALHWTDARDARAIHRHLELRVRRTPYAIRDSVLLTLDAAGLCQ